MSDRARGLVRDAVDRVPERPGDLEAVRARAAQRRTRQRGAMAATAALVLVAAVVSMLVDGPVPRAPVIGSEATHTVLQLRWCQPVLCPDPAMDPEEARRLLEADAAVRSTRLIDAAAVKDEAERSLPPAPIETYASIVEVEVDRDDEPLLDIARRLHETVPRVSIRQGRFGDSPQFQMTATHRYNGFEPEAVAGQRIRILAQHGAGLSVWAVAGGGVCFDLDGLVSCHTNLLMTQTEIMQDHAAWDRREDGGACVWGATGVETDELLVTFDDGTTSAAELGSAPDLLLGQAYLACTDTDTFPVLIEASAPGSSQAMSTEDEDPPRSVVDRVD